MVEKSEKKVDVNFNVNNCKGWKNQTPRSCGGGAIYGLGIIGGWVYFIGQAEVFLGRCRWILPRDFLASLYGLRSI